MLNYFKESNSVASEKTGQNSYACHIWLCATRHIYLHMDKEKFLSSQLQRAKVEQFRWQHTASLRNKVKGERSPPLRCTVEYSKPKATLLSLQWREHRHCLPSQS